MNITYSTPFTVGEIMSKFKTNNSLIQQGNLEPSVKNIPYSPGSWLRRVLTPDISSKPNEDHTKNRAEYLHYYFQFEQHPVEDPADKMSVFKSTGKVLCIPNIVSRWMSCVFGFFEHKGDIVQLNPADLFLYNIYWDLPLDYALKDARTIIPDNRYGDNWCKSMMEYYLKQLLMLGDCEDLKFWLDKHEVVKTNDDGAFHNKATTVYNIPVAELRNSWLAENLENRFTYMKDAKVSTQALLANLLPLGDVVAFGWSQDMDVQYAHLDRMNGGFWKWRDKVQQDTGMKVYAKGWWSKRYKPELKDKSAINFITEEKQKVNKLLQSFYKKGSHIQKSELQHAITSAGIYSEVVLATKSWYKNKFLVDAESMDWILTEKVERVVSEDANVGDTRRLFVTITKPKTGRRK